MIGMTIVFGTKRQKQKKVKRYSEVCIYDEDMLLHCTMRFKKINDSLSVCCIVF